MRLLTHNSLMNNAKDANGKGFPLRITATEIRVDENNDNNNNNNNNNDNENNKKIAFVKGILGMLDWPALVQAAKEMGIPTLPTILTEDLATNADFLLALHHVLMNVHLVRGILTCPVTGREFPVVDGILDMTLEEEECV